MELYIHTTRANGSRVIRTNAAVSCRRESTFGNVVPGDDVLDNDRSGKDFLDKDVDRDVDRDVWTMRRCVTNWVKECRP